MAQTTVRSAPARQARPNFEGVWSIVTITPLQRPKELEGKPYLTAEEARNYVSKRAAEVDFDRRGATPEADLQTPGVNEFWAERGPLAFVDGRFQTSQIV